MHHNAVNITGPTASLTFTISLQPHDNLTKMTFNYNAAPNDSSSPGVYQSSGPIPV